MQSNKHTNNKCNGHNRNKLRHLGLFAGIGGFELGLGRAGHPTIASCEIDDAARAVLKGRLLNVTLHKDIRYLKYLPAEAQLLTAGFPCQDLSQAGRLSGINGSNSGLVGHVFRLLGKRRVEWVIIENVPFMLQLSRGQAMKMITSSLEKLGYSWAYRVVDSRAFGLPQRRLRVFLLAAIDQDPRSVLYADDAGEPDGWPTNGKTGYGFYWTEGNRGLGWGVDCVPTLKGGSSWGVPSPPAIWMPSGKIVKPHIRDAERLQGFPCDWTKPAEKVTRPSTRWRLVGNAVTVPVARWLGQRLSNPGPSKIKNVRRLDSNDRWPIAAWNVGEGKYTGDISSWPKAYKWNGIANFLREEPEPLSYRASKGFLERLLKSNLRARDDFIEALQNHVEQFKVN